MGHLGHRATSPRSIACAVLTISDTRTTETDESGRLTRELLEGAGHRVAHAEILPDDPSRVAEVIGALLVRDDVEAVLINGGTGISPRDSTHEAVLGLLDRRLDGFGELFRALSYDEIGAAAMLSRALAGMARGRVLFSMPGSPAAVRLALEKLILPELGHIVGEARKT
jgi:molybdenum cofactor biosynthesis protein B